MSPEESLVILLNDSGEVVGSKPRKDIDKVKDILWCSDVLVFNENRELWLAKIPEGALYTGTWAATTATLLRERETPEEAAHRSMMKEVGIDTSITGLGDHFFTYSDGVRRKKSTFFCTTNLELEPNPKDIAELKAWNRNDLEAALKTTPNLFAPTFRGIWEEYQSKLPF